MQLHGTWIWTRLLLVVLRQWSCLNFSIVLLKNHRICQPLGEVKFAEGWTSKILHEDFIFQGNTTILKSGVIQGFEFQSSSFHWCIYVLFIYSKLIWHFLHTVSSSFSDLVCGPWEPFWCYVLFYLALPHETCLHVDACVYLSLDGNLPLHLQPGAFQLGREVERRRGKNSRRWFVSILADETTPPHFPEAMVIGKAVFHLISCNFENPVATVKKKLIGTYFTQ